MELRELRYFVAVAEEQSFIRAAKRLHMSQPPLSLQIKNLEKELGVKLLERRPRKVFLTDEGRILLDRARVILNEVQEAEAELKGAKLGVGGKIEVGFISSVALNLLPPAIRLFRERYEKVKVELRELSSEQQAEALYKGEIQVGLIRQPFQAPYLETEPVLEERLVLAMPGDHPLSTLEEVPLEEIRNLPMVFFTRQLSPTLYAKIVRLHRRADVFPTIVQDAAHLQTIIGLVASGAGLAILPGSAEWFVREDVAYRPLDAPDGKSWVGLAWLEGAGSALVQNFARVVREAAANEAAVSPPSTEDRTTRS
ncbi:MAG: LysR family transcriptional regulator [Rubrobacteraceae bacterium]